MWKIAELKILYLSPLRTATFTGKHGKQIPSKRGDNE